MLGYDEDEIDEVLGDLDRIEAQGALEALGEIEVPDEPASL